MFFILHYTSTIFPDSDIPKDLCPLYRPGEWEDLASEKDINPFSKFKSMSKEKRQQKVEKFANLNSMPVKSLDKEKSTDFECLKLSENSLLVMPPSGSLETSSDSVSAESSKKAVLEIYTTKCSEKQVSLDLTKDNSLLQEDGFTELEEASSQADSREAGRGDIASDCKMGKEVQLQATNADTRNQLVLLDSSGKQHVVVPKETLDLESSEKLDMMPELKKGGSSPTVKIPATLLDAEEEERNKDNLIEYYLGKDKDESQPTAELCKTETKGKGNNRPVGIDLTLSCSHSQTTEILTDKRAGTDSCSIDRKEPLAEDRSAPSKKGDHEGPIVSSLLPPQECKRCQEIQLDNKSEIRLWLMQRVQVPIEGRCVFSLLR